MKIRVVTIIAAALLLLGSSGCSGMRNFLFGRGARCGLCTNLTPPLFNNVAPAPPCGPTCETPVYAPVQPLYAPMQTYPSVQNDTCSTCYSPSADCAHGGIVAGGVPADPYLSPAGVESYASPIGGYPVEGSVIGGSGYMGVPQTDNFYPRPSVGQPDIQGDIITSVNPLPAG